MFVDNKFKLIPRQNDRVPTVSLSPKDGGGMLYVISIRGPIDGPEYYAIVCDILYGAKEGDTIIISLNSPGGVVATGMAIIAAMAACKGQVITRAVGMVASCAAMIWSYGDELQASLYARIMFHSSAGGYMGKTRDMIDYGKGVEDMMKELVRPAIERKILTDAQFETAFDENQDFYLNAKDLQEAEVDCEIIS